MSLSLTLVRYEVSGPIAHLRLNRPDKLNAINALMIRELHLALDAAEADAGVGAVLLSGLGRAFSAGFDLEVGDGTGAPRDLAFWREELRRDFDIIMRFWDCPKPTVAAVHGYCLGSAMEMAVACDITVCSPDCRFGAPEVKFGSGIVALILPWLIGFKAAKELLLTGCDTVSADRALGLGLVNHVTGDDRFLDHAKDIATDMACNDRLAGRLTKQAINRSAEIMGMRKAMLEALELDAQIEATESEDSRDFNRILSEQGVKAALAWRRDKFNT